MAKSQNGWPVVTSGLTSLPHITGRALNGPVWVVLYWLCREYARTVEPIRKAWSWGYSHRRISGSTKWSNHASGTAVDLNAPRHPAGKTGTFTQPQRDAIRLILAASRGVLRWGQVFKDEMHFEIAPGITPTQVEHLAATILQVALAELGYYHGQIDGIRGPKTKAATIAFQASRSLPASGIDTPITWAAISAAQEAQAASIAD